MARADSAAVAMGASPEVRGARVVAETFSGRAQAARPALVDGAVGLVWSVGGQPGVVFVVAFERARIGAIDLVADPDRIRQLELAKLAG